MAEDERPPLLAIIYSEFDIHKGPTIMAQAPASFLKTDTFEQISDFLITDRALCHKLITIFAFGYKFMGYPAVLMSDLYGRKTFFWNVCFVFPTEGDASMYEPVLCKLACALEEMELESQFLFKQPKPVIEKLLEQIWDGLRTAGECSVVANDTSLDLRLCPRVHSSGAIAVEDHDVPVRVYDLDGIEKSSWDLTLQQVVPFIDGVNYVKRIAALSQVALPLCREAIRQLIYFKAIVLVDIYQYSNVYVPTSGIHKLATNVHMQKACMTYIVIHPGRRTAPFRNVFRLYCSLQRGVRMGTFCSQNKLIDNNIHPRKFAMFGVMNGLIRRVHKYPIVRPSKSPSYFGPATEEQSEQVSTANEEKNAQSVRSEPSDYRSDYTTKTYRTLTVVDRSKLVLDGTISYDHICCMLGKSYSEIDADIRSSEDCVIISR